MSHTPSKAIADQHTERVPDVGSTRSDDGSRDDTIKDAATTEIIAAEDYTVQWVNGTPEEKKLVRKLDWRILPCTWVLYLLGFLDRANIG